MDARPRRKGVRVKNDDECMFFQPERTSSAAERARFSRDKRR